MSTLVDTKILHKLLVEILSNDKALMLEVFRTIMSDNPNLLEELNTERRERLDKIIDEDFEEYHEVFKALA